VNRLATFAVLFMTAILLELVEPWRQPGPAIVAFVLFAGILALGVTRVTVLVFLAAATAYYLAVDVPDVANHVNIEIYCGALVMAGILHSLVRRRDFPTDDDVFEMLRPILQASLMLIYALAGFAKLNTDFFDPQVSCASATLGPLLETWTVTGLPKALVAFAVALPVADRLLASSGRGRHLALPVRLAVLVLALAGGVAAFGLAPHLPPAMWAGAIIAMAVTVILWELGGGLLLAVPRLQALILAVSLAMHAALALVKYVDFSALALALLFAFLPRPWFDVLNRPARLPWLGRPVQRLHLYLLLCLLSGVLAAFRRRLPAGLVFNLALVVLLWPVLSAALAARPRPAWAGVPLSFARTPSWLLVFPALLLLHGLTSYLGLRTAGNFTMFSNLRTEGERSSHLLLGSNPLKRWNYQEDVVRFLRIDDARAEIGYAYKPLQGFALPVVEYRKLIYRWTRAGMTVPVTFEYRGQVHSSEDIVHDPVWRTTERDWEMRLMDFRVIQEEGPNACRW
jgi:hypothetical protein